MDTNKGSAEHTGGDWQIIKQNHDSHVVIESGEVNIAVVMLGDCPDGSTGEANACLIATAPALLAACRSALTRLQSIYNNCHVDSANEISILTSAISQAGEKPE